MSYLTNSSITITGDTLEDILLQSVGIVIDAPLSVTGSHVTSYIRSAIKSNETHDQIGLLVDCYPTISDASTLLAGILSYILPPAASTAQSVVAIYAEVDTIPVGTTIDFIANLFCIGLDGTGAIEAWQIVTGQEGGSNTGGGIQINSVFGNSVNNYGLKIENISGTGPFAIFTGTGPISFGDITLLPTSTTARASLRIPHGTAPTAPVNGDAWTTSAGLFIRINGATVGPLT